MGGLLILVFVCMAPALRGPGGLLVALIATFLLGLQQSIGETSGCIRFRRLPPIALSCWGAGTGIAGVVMPLLYTLISHLHLADRFLCMLPVVAIYLAVSTALYYVSKRDSTRLYEPDDDGLEVSEEFEMSLTPSENSTEHHGQKVAAMFAAVYGLEYFIFPTLVDRA